MNPQEHFFQSFFGPQNAQIQQQTPGYIIHNEYILEIINNWSCVNELMTLYVQGKVTKLDSLEQTWLTFLTQNNIDITKYKNEEEFLKTFWRIP